ncbi:SDR family oxidoreductase [Kitasatospora sp. NPDC015120]|uniref:SDR family oxidoreductase n=1 Tax=Kitasatospora sp. NPDC015120 TaxID=3364023 RepID=UPI0036F46D5B
MDLKLTGKTAVVTGASRGIGLATVRTLIDEGVRVVGAARTITPEFRDTGAHPVAADLSTPEGVTLLIDTALTELGGIDLLVNNVGGGNGTTVGFDQADDAVWMRAFELNLLATVRATRAALPSLIERRGAIVNISSISGLVPGAFPVTGAVSAAITAFGKSVSEEFGPRGVRVNTVSPSMVNTTAFRDPNGEFAQWAAAADVTVDELIQRLIKDERVTAGRITEPEEVAALIAFLLSDVAGNITGGNHLIDGGMNKTV